MRKNQRKTAVVFEPLISPDINKRMIYRLAKNANGVRLLAINDEYYQKCVRMDDPTQFFIGMDTDVLLPLLGDKKNWKKIADAMNTVEPFKSLSKNYYPLCAIPWLYGLWLCAEESHDKYLDLIARLSSAQTIKELISKFDDELSGIPEESLTEDKRSILNACKDKRAGTDLKGAALNGIVKMYDYMAKLHTKRSCKMLNVLDAAKSRDDGEASPLIIVSASNVADSSMPLIRVAYELTRSFPIAQYLDTEAVRALDGINFWQKNFPLGGAAVQNNAVSAFPVLLSHASSVYFSLSTLTENKSSMNAWMSANTPEVLRELPNGYDKLLVDNYPAADQSTAYVTIAEDEEAEKHDSQIAPKKLVLCFVDTESKVQTIDAGRYLKQAADSSHESEELKQEIVKLQATLDQLTESLQQKEEDVGASDDPYGEYPDQFSEQYSYLDER